MAIQTWEIADRESWLRKRSLNLNASEIGALFSCSPYVTKFQLWMEKAGKLESRTLDSGVLRRGRVLEQAVADAVAEERPDWTITKATDYYWDDDLRIGCTPDFHAWDKTAKAWVTLQAKTAAPIVYEEEWIGRPPKWIVIQNAVECMLTDSAAGAIACLVVDPWKLPLHIHEIPRRSDVEDAIKNRAFRFWKSIDEDMQPDPSEHDSEPLKRLWPESDPETTLNMAGDMDFSDRCAAYVDLGKRIKALTDERTGMQPAIMAKMTRAQYALAPGYKVSWRTETRAAYAVKESTFRKFEIRKVKT